MKRILCIVLAVFSFAFCFAQQKSARVTLKSGVVITGTITELNPASHLMIQVAGINSRIEMGDVASIEDVAPSDVSAEKTISNPSEANSGPVVIDQGMYPDTYTIKVGPYDIEMILVKGALFDMGYDGKGSLRKNSEPVHKVQLSSYYVNKSPLSKDIVSYLKKGDENHSDKTRRYSPGSAKDAIKVAEALASKANLPIVLISEAQCEYILVSDNVENFDINEKYEVLFCRDYYADYTKGTKPQVDPIGPREGRANVMRDFAAKEDEVYTRYQRNPYQPSATAIRVSVPASAVFPQ